MITKTLPNTNPKKNVIHVLEILWVGNSYPHSDLRLQKLSILPNNCSIHSAHLKFFHNYAYVGITLLLQL